MDLSNNKLSGLIPQALWDELLDDGDGGFGAVPKLPARCVFPIYHIPPTDCPYKTDIYFYNQRRGAVVLVPTVVINLDQYRGRLTGKGTALGLSQIMHDCLTIVRP